MTDRIDAIEAAARSGDLAGATKLAHGAYADGLRHPLINNLLALELEQAGRFDEALQLLRDAVAVAPADVGALLALAIALLRLEDGAGALTHVDAALAVAPNLAPAHANRGMALQVIGRPDLAEASFRHALTLDPNSIAAKAGLAALQSMRGAHQEARGLAEAVLARMPGYPEAELVVAAADLAEGATDKTEARAQRLVAEPRATPLERARALTLVGDARDAHAQTDAAFAAYDEAARTLKGHYAPRYESRASARDNVAWQSAYFDQAPRELWARADFLNVRPPAVQGHVYLLGFPRSGTTLLENALAGHSRIAALDEQEALVDGVRAYLRSPETLAALGRESEQALIPLREAYWRRVVDAGVAISGKVLLDKHPFNSLKLALIARFFPDAKILFVLRDPRDVVWSCFRRRFQMSAPFYELLGLERAARFYAAVMALAHQIIEAAQLDVRFVRHEAVVANFDSEMRAIAGFVGLDVNADFAAFASRIGQSASATPSVAQLARGLSSDGVGAWRRYEKQLRDVLPILEPWVKRLGY
jgi:tetratricopeptide (TPR) repeat protein